MLSILPTWAYPFLFAILAAIFAALLGRRSAGGPLVVASAVLYAVAAACAIIGVVAIFLDRI